MPVRVTVAAQSAATPPGKTAPPSAQVTLRATPPIRLRMVTRSPSAGLNTGASARSGGCESPPALALVTVPGTVPSQVVATARGIIGDEAPLVPPDSDATPRCSILRSLACNRATSAHNSSLSRHTVSFSVCTA